MFSIPLLGDLMLTQMAESWANDEIFSDKHITPHEEGLISAVFPAVKVMMGMSYSSEMIIRTDCGLVFELIELAVKDRFIKVDHPAAKYKRLPVFESCKLLHRDQLVHLQKAIDVVKSMRGRKLVLSN